MNYKNIFQLMQNKYNYPSIERVDIEGIGRHYLDSNNNPVPSVTTVLGNTSTKSDGIAQWRNRVGEEEAERVIKQSTDIGTAVHESIEKYLNGDEWDSFGEGFDQLLAKKITNKFVSHGLLGISEKASEEQLRMRRKEEERIRAYEDAMRTQKQREERYQAEYESSMRLSEEVRAANEFHRQMRLTERKLISEDRKMKSEMKQNQDALYRFKLKQKIEMGTASCRERV